MGGSHDGLFPGETLTGEVVGVVYRNRDTGFGVVEVDVAGAGGARCAGPLAGLVAGQSVRLVGRWTDHPRHGRTFDVTYYEQTVPTTEEGLRAFLLSERFKGVGRPAVERILAAFGADSGWVIERETARLVAEAGLRPDIADLVATRWSEGKAFADLAGLAGPAGLPRDVVRAAFAWFGPETAEVLRADPYRLLDVDRARFPHADALARHLGVEVADPRRLAAAARAAHAAARGRNGHQYLTRSQLVVAAAALLDGADELAAAGVDAAVAGGRLVADDAPGAVTPGGAIYTPSGLEAERDLAAHLVALATARSRVVPHAEKVTPSPELTAGQAAAVRLAFSAPVSVLTGGPGTGKTRTVEEIVAAAEAAGLTVALAAPTGRAAKRLEELVGRPAATVHRLLEARPVSRDERRAGGARFSFVHGPGDPLPHDLVICDEVSMCDTALAAALVTAVDEGSHLVLVGDPDQLPSVGPGDVLADLLRSEIVPSVRLTEVHRQAAGSRIVALANEINRGALGPLRPADGDVFLAEEPDRGRIVPRVVEAVTRRVPAHLGIPPDDVQVVAPVYRGDAGVDALNTALKAALNPGAGPAVAGFHVGDRVMQSRNDAERDVYNGDIGTVVDVDPGQGVVRVAFPRGEVTCTAEQARELLPAWAVTVHKSQGGEWPVVVFVCDRSHRGMLWRNLAYTAVTRAQRALIVVGQAAALATAAAHDRPRNRQTLLAARLRAALGAEGRPPSKRGRSVQPASPTVGS